MSTKILFVGDVFLDKAYTVDLSDNHPLILNLEAPISNRGTPIEGKINLVMKEGLLEEVFHPLPAAVSLANNHIMDFGNEAFEDTLSNLSELGISFFGAGVACENYNNPLIKSFDGMKLGLLGYCYAFYYDQIKNVKGLVYGPAPLEVDRVKNDINRLKGEVDRIVVSIHWGVEECNYPERDQVHFARDVIKMGSDCIVGHHAHTIQAVEKYGDGIIAYNIGNYIFPNLNFPAYYNDKGESMKCFQKQQRVWNRSSIGFLVDLETNKFETLPFYFDGLRVLGKKTFFHRYASCNLETKINKLDYLVARDRKIKQLLYYVLEYIKNPKIIKISTVLNFFKQLLFKKNIAKKWSR